MVIAKTGDRVKVHFEGYLEDGTVFGSTTGEKPFEFIIGEKNMLPGFENAVIGMKKGDTKTTCATIHNCVGIEWTFPARETQWSLIGWS